MGVFLMTNREKLKKAIEQDINPTNNYNKIIKKIEKEEKMKKENNLLKWSLVPICLIVIISGIIFLNYKKDNNNSLENKTYINKENNTILNINDLSKVGMTKLDADVKTVSGVNIPYPFKVNENQNEEWFIIPRDLTQTKNYIVYVKKDKDSKEYDTVANYIMLITDGNERSIEIKYAKEQEPLRDYYFSEENSKITTINGIDLKIYKYENSFYTTFSYNGYYFDIETSNITEQEFSNYLVSILK